MKKVDVKPVNQARAFDISELFFSTTDQKGIVRSWNDVFARVANYEPSDLSGKPHNIIRHPDMPRCVFKLLWDYLLSGRSIGAYVKNLAKTGEYYWVFALAAPCPSGFLSVRLKPTSTLLTVVEGLYKELLAKENEFGSDWRSGMQAGACLLTERLKSLEIDSYDDFMTEALRQELSARRKALIAAEMHHDSKVPLGALGAVFDSLDLLTKLRSDLNTQESSLIKLDMQLSHVSLNSGVRATHLGDSGRALGIIGKEVSRISKQVREEVETLNREIVSLTESLRTTTFYISQALLQSEMSADFEMLNHREPLSETQQISRFGAPTREICSLLNSCAAQSIKTAFEGMSDLDATLGSFDYFLQSLTKILLTIQFAYVTGKTQAARISGGEAFSQLLTELRDVSDSARSNLNELGDKVSNVKAQVAKWRESVSSTSPPKKCQGEAEVRNMSGALP